MSFRPCIDLHEGRVKQIVGSTLDTGALRTNFVSERSPAWFAELYRRDGLSGGHVIMLGKGCEDAAREALGAWPGHLQIGGGITPASAAAWLEAGAEKLIVTSWCFPEGRFSPERLKEMLRATGREHLVLDLSCRRRGDDYFVAADRWRTYTDLKVNRETLEMLGSSASEFLVHAVDVEGKQAGIDTELLLLLSGESPIDCVYAGGIRSLEDVKLIDRTSGGRVHYTIGSALDIFGGPLAYADVVAWNALSTGA